MDMHIEFLARPADGDTEALREHAFRKLSFATRRFKQHVRHVRLRVIDENGPRRGVDTRCTINADLVDGRQLFVEGLSAWPFAAVTLAAGRFGEALRRYVDRRSVHRDDTFARSDTAFSSHAHRS